MSCIRQCHTHTIAPHTPLTVIFYYIFACSNHRTRRVCPTVVSESLLLYVPTDENAIYWFPLAQRRVCTAAVVCIFRGECTAPHPKCIYGKQQSFIEPVAKKSVCVPFVRSRQSVWCAPAFMRAFYVRGKIYIPEGKGESARCLVCSELSGPKNGPAQQLLSVQIFIDISFATSPIEYYLPPNLPWGAKIQSSRI